jgi:hypothetical protein
MVEIFQLLKRNIGKPWLVHLSIGSKRKINEMVKACPMDMNRLSTRADLKIIPLGSYDFIIGMDWLDQHHVVLYYYYKAFTFLDEEGNLGMIHGISREVTIWETSSFQMKKCFRKGCQLFVAHMEETPMDKVPNIEDCVGSKMYLDKSQGYHPR